MRPRDIYEDVDLFQMHIEFVLQGYLHFILEGNSGTIKWSLSGESIERIPFWRILECCRDNIPHYRRYLTLLRMETHDYARQMESVVLTEQMCYLLSDKETWILISNIHTPITLATDGGGGLEIPFRAFKWGFWFGTQEWHTIVRWSRHEK